MGTVSQSENQPVKKGISINSIYESIDSLSKMQFTEKEDALFTFFEGSLLAGACGDALGYPIEFISIQDIQSMYGKDGITEMDINGVSNLALISDDTQMDIYTAQGLINGHKKHCGFNEMIQEIHKSYYRWYITQQRNLSERMKTVYPLNEIEQDELITPSTKRSLCSRRAPGCTCLSALSSGKLGTKHHAINDSKGCGGVMRVAPIGMYFWKSPEEAYRYGEAASALTHSHKLGYQSGGALAMILAYIFNQHTLRESIQMTIDFMKTQPYTQEMIDVIKKAVEVADHRLEGERAFSILGEGWVGEEALAIALWAALMYPDDLKKALLLSVNHSGDSDSTGCICGYIMGALLGTEAIPQEWLSVLELKDLIVKQAKEIYSMVK